MRQFLKISSAFSILFIVMLGFQNCTIYQSEGMKYLDSAGVVDSSVSSSNNTNSFSSTTGNKQMALVEAESCAQYSNQDLVKAYFDSDKIKITSIVDTNDLSLQCLLSAPEVENSDIINCRYHPSIRSLVDFPSESMEIVEENESMAVFKQVKDNQLCFSGGNSISKLGVSCCAQNPQDQGNRLYELTGAIIEGLE
ncbi:MAG: hypothetical protein AB8E15_04145 [Bdellovibrionales bacterium]